MKTPSVNKIFSPTLLRVNSSLNNIEKEQNYTIMKPMVVAMMFGPISQANSTYSPRNSVISNVPYSAP